MSVDLTNPPWDRLAKLAPSGTGSVAIQETADRWAVTADLYAAAADLWEEFANSIDVAPDDTSGSANAGRIQSVSQDGVSVTYANDGLAGDSQSTRVAQYQQAMNKVRYYRSKSKPNSPLMHSRDYNPYTGKRPYDAELWDDDTIIVVSE